MNSSQLFENMLIMAAADGSLSQGEVELLSARCGDWGISADEFKTIVTRAFSPDAALNIPARHTDRVHMLQEMLRVMGADGELAESEKQLFAAVAATMEIPNDELHKIIDGVVPKDDSKE